ncbi:MAG: glycosyltransferase family 2 protein [Bacteroidales bacterium]|jgi:dolichol-phosphate mannosyltransferase|nr:glycosyltransferase family 2 protein [Bacteroidales bacterium]
MITEKIACSIVASVYNEEEGLILFYEKLTHVLSTLNIAYEIIFVNDGSIDNSLFILENLAKKDNNIKIINFSRNFGHEAAMIAGIDYSSGDAVICMDSDLQHPPEMIPEMLQKNKEGFEVVNMVRTDRYDAGIIQKMNSKLFYRFINKISNVKLVENASDFFLVSAKVCEILRTNYRERSRFLRGIIQLVGFSKTTIEYVAKERIAGKSKYSFFKLLMLSFTAISSFSKFPLQLGIIIGLFFCLVSFVLIIYSVIMWILESPVSGYTTLIVFLSAFAGIQLLITGIIGQYISYMFDEIKGRPIYVVNNTYNFKNNSNL